MKTQLNSHINVASDSFNLTGQLREMNEAVTHCEVNRFQARSSSEVLWNCIFLHVSSRNVCFRFLKILLLGIFLQLCTNRVTFLKLNFVQKFQIGSFCRLTKFAIFFTKNLKKKIPFSSLLSTYKY